MASTSNSWMVPNLTLEAESDLERGRMMLQQMTPEQVLAQAHVLLEQAVTNGVIIRQAARRICELEACAAVQEPVSAPRPDQWAREVLEGLG